MSRQPVFSIVIPVFQNQASLDTTIPRLIETGRRLEKYKVELIFVDDGSSDGSYNILQRYHTAYPGTIRVVKLTRNFGQNQAIKTGLAYASGDCTGIISADLQDPPELFQKMISLWEKGTRLVIAERAARAETGLRGCFSTAYWKLLRRYVLPGFPVGGFDFCLFDRQVRESMNAITEKNLVVFPLLFWLGYDFKVIKYNRVKRENGVSQWSVAKKVKLTIDTFINFTYLPIKFITYMGVSVSSLAFFYALVVFVKRLFWGIEIQGWGTIVILVSFFGGMILFSLGIMGEYLWRILEETRNRPASIVESVLD
jgi:polyisoprenyl-phosphate glycosyltransferase